MTEVERLRAELTEARTRIQMFEIFCRDICEVTATAPEDVDTSGASLPVLQIKQWSLDSASLSEARKRATEAHGRAERAIEVSLRSESERDEARRKMEIARNSLDAARQRFYTIGLSSTDEVWPTRAGLRATCDIARIGEDNCNTALARIAEPAPKGKA